MTKQSVIISGKNGQLGCELQEYSRHYDHFSFHFFDKAGLDIADFAQMEQIFQQLKPAFFINAAAYTAVDKAETEQEKAYLVNAEATGNIARLCSSYNTILVHISTDYVFDGKGSKPYTETDQTHPVNYYGYTKWLGEKLALENNPSTIIIRTSWVYSKYGSNFVKTMLRLMHERSSINVVNDQRGSPTYAADLAKTILDILSNPVKVFGIYHYSNEGDISWYDFAVAIGELSSLHCLINPIPSVDYPTPAKRPEWSVLSKSKIQDRLGIAVIPWKESLKKCLQQIEAGK